MRQTTTDGRIVEHVDICTCCSLDTTGQHEDDCPCREDTVLAEANLEWYKQRLGEIDGAGGVV